jgi:IS5 family transposase
METYLRLMFLKFRYRLGYERLCREVNDSITWRRFARIGLAGTVPDPTTLMKLTKRFGPSVVDALNEALLARAGEAKVLRTARLRADTTVLPANVAYPTDSGLLAKAVRRIGATVRRIRAAGGATRTRVRDRGRSAGAKAHAIGAKLRSRSAAGRDEAQTGIQRVTAELADLAARAARDAEKVLVNARRAVRRAEAKAKARLGRGSAIRRRAGVGARYGAPLMTWATCWRAPGGSWRRPGNGCPAPPRTGPPGRSACTTPTRGRSPRAGSDDRSSSDTRRRSPTPTTA